MESDGVDSSGGSDNDHGGDNDSGGISEEAQGSLDGVGNDNDDDGGDDDVGSDISGGAGTDGFEGTEEDDELTEEEAVATNERMEAEGRAAAEAMGDVDAPEVEEAVDVDAEVEEEVEEEEIDLEARKDELTAEIAELAEETISPGDFATFASEVSYTMEDTVEPELQEHIAAVALDHAIEAAHMQGSASYRAAELVEAMATPEHKGIMADAIVAASEAAFDAGEIDPFEGHIPGPVDFGGGFHDNPEVASYVAEAYAERARDPADAFAERALNSAIAVDVVTTAETLTGQAERITGAMENISFASRHTELSTELYEAIDAGTLNGQHARDLITGTLDVTIARDDLSANLDRGLAGDRYRDALAGAMAKAHDTGTWEYAALRQEVAERHIDAALQEYLDANPTTRMQLAAAWNNPGQAAIGAGKNFVNGIVGIAELGASGALHLGGYVNDGFTAIAETAGFQSAAAHAANADALHGMAAGIDWQPFELTNHAQQGGAVIGTGLELATGIAALAKAGAVNLARHADDIAGTGTAAAREFPTTGAIGLSVTGTRAIDRARGYEDAIRDLYTDVTVGRREFEVIVDGQTATRYADDVILVDGLETAVDAKFVDDWAASLRNPESPTGGRPWSVAEQEKMLEQAQNYADQFPGGAIYHTNDVALARHYDTLFREAGIDNIEFVVTPTR